MIDNPFAALSASIPAEVMQAYVVLMVILVAAGTIIDVIHKKSARYFFENAKKAEASRTRKVPGGESADQLNERLFHVEAGILPGRLCDMARRGEHGPLGSMARFSFGPLPPGQCDADMELMSRALARAGQA